jgi:hypothetical protein
MMRQILITAVCLAVLTACHSTSGQASSPVATAITPPPGAHHSSIADVFVPPNASLEPAEDTAPGAERWDIRASYSDAVAQEEALLPVGGSLNSYPWCQKTPMPPGSTNNMSWIWGRPRDAVIVSVLPVTDNYSTIVIQRSNNADMYCK